MYERKHCQDIFKDRSIQHEALCWWLSDIDSKNDSDQQSTLNAQRYILAFLYFSNGCDEQTNNQKWMSSYTNANGMEFRALFLKG